MSKYQIIACGQSAKDWEPLEGYHSIGVNDCFKWGKPTDHLIVCNRPSQFTASRYQTIINSTPKYFYTQCDAWEKFVVNRQNRKSRLVSNNPSYPEIRFLQWSGHLYPDTVFYNQTSPFIALSLALHFGAREIVMYGCDFVDHKIYNSGNPGTKTEVQVYMDLIQEMEKQGCNVFLGANGTAFDKLISIYGDT